VIRFTTDAGLTGQYADAIEALLPDPCTHRDRPSCPKCAESRDA
jgi:hypothetical protein